MTHNPAPEICYLRLLVTGRLEKVALVAFTGKPL